MFIGTSSCLMQEKSKTMIMQIFFGRGRGGQKCIIGFEKVENFLYEERKILLSSFLTVTEIKDLANLLFSS